jgi:hypothetical protein
MQQRQQFAFCRFARELHTLGAHGQLPKLDVAGSSPVARS